MTKTTAAKIRRHLHHHLFPLVHTDRLLQKWRIHVCNGRTL